VALKLEKSMTFLMDGRNPTGMLASDESGVEVITKIKDNLWQVGGMGLTNPSDAAVYLVRFGDKAALIDAGTGRDHEKLTKNITDCLGSDAQLEYLLLTHSHFDHTGGARAVRDEYGCRIVAHELDAVYLESGDDRVTGAAMYSARFEPLSIDIKLQGQESTLAVGSGTMTAIHCPGHSPGSVVYTTEIDGQFILFGQDVHGPLRSELLSDEQQYLESLAKLENMQADILLEGHFGVIETKQEVREFIKDCITLPQQPCRC
jgi:glyoxylase-like metal-dependent hydrolase (beta-lactamase superfamily II)